MAAGPALEAMPAEQGAVLAEFARACRTAARSVALYPATHPAIRGALTRVAGSARRLAGAGSITVSVFPDLLAIDGRAPSRPDTAIVELASLLHERLIGSFTVNRDADEEDWHAMLLLLSRAAEELIAQGGIAACWQSTGRPNFEFQEIDYAEVLRERAGGQPAEWDRIIAFCLQDGERSSLDERALATLMETVGHPERLGELLCQVESAAASGGAAVGACAAAILQLLRTTLGGVAAADPTRRDDAVQTFAEAAARLTPETMLAIIAQRQSPDGESAQLASDLIGRMTDESIAAFVAGSVAAEHGATDRLAQAFEVLVPESERKDRLLSLALEEARKTELAREAHFEDLWQDAADMLKSYSDKSFVSEEYARELSNARTQALEVERVADDPPERIHAWLGTVSDVAIRQLDLDLLMDLLRIESDPVQWHSVADAASQEVERRAVLGQIADAQRLIDGLTRELGPEGRPGLRERAQRALEALSGGHLVRHVVLQLRQVDDAAFEPLMRLCHSIGAGLVQPLAVALASEEEGRAIRRLRELLLGFGAAARTSVEQLKGSSNPAVRRTAIELLRVLGGDEALPELASLLNDADPQVQRESIRAIVQIGTPKACAVLERALDAGPASRDLVIEQLLALRDKKAIPLLCYVVTHTAPRGALAQVHATIVEMLGASSAHPESTRALKHVLYRGEWWAPYKTAALRRAAATALRRLGSADAVAVLQEAASSASRRVRSAARAQAELAARRERERA